MRCVAKEVGARYRQELPIFSVIKITDKVQPKPGIAYPKKEREGEEQRERGR